MDSGKEQKRKTNPWEEANIFSLLTFWYTLGIFKKGLRKDLEEEDLYDVNESFRSKTCGDKSEKKWNKSHSVYQLLWARFGVEYTIICLATIVWTEIYSVAQPYGMSRLISYFEGKQTKIPKVDAYYYAGIVVFLKVFSAFFWQNIAMYQYNCGIKIRASLKSLLFRKALKLSPASFSKTNLGNIVTILTKDIHSIEENVWILMEFVIYIVQIGTISYLLWAKMGYAALIGLGIFFIVLPIQLYLSTLLTKIRLKVGKNSDERLNVTQETLSAIKIIKMYTWEIFFHKKITESRKKEVTMMIKAYYIKFVVVVIGLFTSKITFLLIILSHIWMGYSTNTEMIFYVLSLFSDLSYAFGITIPQNLSRAAEFQASFIRLSRLLQAEEVKEIHVSCSDKPFVNMKDVTVRMEDITLIENISIKMDSSGLTIITGAVGSGKSSLLKTILRDFSISQGDIEVEGSVSYASQEPWLFPSSIKQNILFGGKYDKSKYEEVLRVCALEYDLSLLEHGDQTLVADRGLNLSKGQKSRINLARAIYKNSDIYLLDDSLTALDGQVQDFIFKECIQKYLKYKICILVTQNENHVKQADNVVIMEEGRMNFSKQIVEMYQNGITAQGEVENNVINSFNLSQVTNVKNDSELDQQESKPNVYHETKKCGKVDITVYKKYFMYGGGFFFFSLIILLYIVAQSCESYSDQLLTKWIDLQQEVLDLESNDATNETAYEEILSQKDDIFSFYTIMIITKSTLGLIKFYVFLRFCRNASVNIHKAMSFRIVNAVMPFFDKHFIGNILNRFSHDLSNIDENLPFLFPDLINILFICGGAIILMATVSWLLLIPTGLFLITLVLMRMGYVASGRSLKRLEAATRSPLVGHINSSFEGLTTIRAFKAEQILKDQFDRHQDVYTSACFTLLSTITGFGFFMDILSSILVMLVVARFLLFNHDISAGNVGLVLTQVFVLTEYVQWVVRQWAQLENDMTSVERVLEYTDIKQENSTRREIENWPSESCIVYENVALYYENTKEPVLKNISFTVKSKQKIGIVGRTGAGKSSIISTLYRLYNYQGKILIDDVDISNLPLTFLRKSIGIIPQDPILFSGTIRENIDPYNNYTDAEIWKAIGKVKIKHLIPNLELQIQENGSNFSAGQKQLICLTRAAVGKCKIVVLDEATANMDPVTEKMLHSVIEELFSECTILTIAHRLHSILHYDMVMVLDHRELIEFDNPRKLLKNKSSNFYKMCQRSGMALASL